MTLSNKTALITGGGTGIGAAIAKAFAADGCRTVISGRRENKLRETAAAFSGEPKLIFKAVDVADRASVAELFAWARDQLGRIDILVNSAGVNVPKRSMAELDPDDWDLLMLVNATGAYNCMVAALPQMRAASDGLIINISSIAGKRTGPLGGVAYNASKFAMSALGLTVGAEEKDHGIRVTSIYPGEVDTPILENRPTPVSDEHRASILQSEDIAAAARMVANLPARAHIPELIIKPTTQLYV